MFLNRPLRHEGSAPLSSNPFAKIESLFLRPHRPALVLALGCLLIQSLLVLPIPLIQGRLLDELAADLSNWRRPFFAALGLTLGCLSGRFLASRGAAAIMNRVVLEVVRELTTALHRKVQSLPLAYLDRHDKGGIISRLTSDVGTLMIVLNSGTLQLVGDLVLAVGIAGVLVAKNGKLALAALAVVPLAALGTVAFRKPLARQSHAARERFGATFSYLAERLPQLRLIRAFNQERAERNRFENYLKPQTEACRQTLRTAAIQMAAAAAAAGIGSALVLLVGVGQIDSRQTTAGELLAFYSLAGLLYVPIVRLAQFQGGLAATREALIRMLEILDEPIPAAAQESPANRAAIELTGVTFRYRADSRVVLRDITLRVPVGQSLGVAGPSGSGKTTLLALLANLYRAESGRADTPCRVALAPQRPILFEGTIRSNLVYAAPEASEAQLWQALDVVLLGDHVRSRPDGLDSPLGPGGAGLSGGQRQRLSLARALVAEPDVLLLDDCTSALDPETEARVWKNLETCLPNATRIVASSRMSLLQSLDRIVTLEGGRIVNDPPPRDRLES